MLEYVIAGLALGAIYAIASSSLVITFVSAGVLNFSFGSMAYLIARFYYFLHSQHGWPSAAAAGVAVLVAAPLLGIGLDFLLFRHLRTASSLTKVVATIGLSVALPPIADLLFGSQVIQTAPGLAPTQNHPATFFGSPVTNNQLITYGFLVLVVVAGTLVLRFTDVGLKVRALVDSEAMASLSSVNPGRYSRGVWAISTALAGLAGILVAPDDGLSVAVMTALMAAAFAAVVAARLRSLTVAVVVALLMGVVTDVVQKYLPPSSSFAAAVVPSIPFAFILVALVFYLVRSGSLDEGRGVLGPLDSAVRPAQPEVVTGSGPGGHRRSMLVLSAAPLVVVALLPYLFHNSAYWLGLIVLGLAYGVTFLTFTVVTGEGGMLWLSQTIFAGAGALLAAQFVIAWHVPVLLAIGVAAVVAAVFGAIIGLLTIRLGDLYVALVTLTFSLLVETLVFTRNRFLQSGLGEPLARPSFASTDLRFAYLMIVVFAVLALLTLNLRRSTSGMALRAVRDSEPAARTLGLSVVQVKVLVGALAAFVAAVGGGFLGLVAGSAQPGSFPTFAGLVWLAVVVTLGVRSISAAMVAGLSFAILPGVFQTYVPTRFAEVPPLLFGLGAVALAQHPEGSIAHGAAQLRALRQRLRPRPPAADAGAGATRSGIVLPTLSESEPPPLRVDPTVAR